MTDSAYSLLGRERIESLVAAFYRQVPSDPILGPMYPEDDLEGAEHRLASFLVYRLGGPDDYLKERGHPRLRRRHFPFAIDRAARDRWMLLMEKAWEEAGLPEALRPTVMGFFGHVASFLVNRAK